MLAFYLLWVLTFGFIYILITTENEEDIIDTEYRRFLTKYLDVENNLNSKKRDILALMLKNNDETTEYFKISKNQVRVSYVFSILACIFGIILIVLSVYMTLTNVSIKATLITGLSGAITEVIAGTVLWIHNKSTIQLNHYYNALHENEKILSAINLVDKISVDKRDDIYIEIIRKQINIEQKSSNDKT